MFFLVPMRFDLQRETNLSTKAKGLVPKAGGCSEGSLYILPRCCTIEEVASMTKFIVSREASFNTGFCFDLTGGRATY